MDTSVATAIILAYDIDEPRRKCRKWSKDLYLKRELYWHVNLLKELLAEEPEDCRNFRRMDETAFELSMNCLALSNL